MAPVSYSFSFGVGYPVVAQPTFEFKDGTQIVMYTASDGSQHSETVVSRGSESVVYRNGQLIPLSVYLSHLALQHAAVEPPRFVYIEYDSWEIERYA